MFCAPKLIFDSTKGVGSRFHVLCSLTSFWRYRGRRISFSCFALPDSFLAVPRASGLVFLFCATGLVFGGTEGVRSYFHILRSRTRFQRCRGRPFLFSRSALPDSFSAVPELRVPFSCLARPDPFSIVPRTLGPIFVFSTPELIFNGTEGDGSRFHVFSLPDLFSVVPRVFRPVFVFCVP
jgi:hypothetical protein